MKILGVVVTAGVGIYVISEILGRVKNAWRKSIEKSPSTHGIGGKIIAVTTNDNGWKEPVVEVTNESGLSLRDVWADLGGEIGALNECISTHSKKAVRFPSRHPHTRIEIGQVVHITRVTAE